LNYSHNYSKFVLPLSVFCDFPLRNQTRIIMSGGNISMQARRSHMINLVSVRKLALTLLLACLHFWAPSAGATPIKIGLGASPNITSYVADSFAALDGTALQGQTLSLDFSFLNGEFVRLFSITSRLFDAQIFLQTSGLGEVGFLNGNGYLLDQRGNPLEPPQDLGSASGNDGSMAAGLFPLLGDGLHRPRDFFGVHFDLTLPDNPSVFITGSAFKFLSDPDLPFGVGPGVPHNITVPDAGSSVLLLCFGLLGLAPVRMRLT
jgi:hypothetical protein